jgi:type IV pilus assembly protein PilA
MLESIKRQVSRDEDQGFTLIELMVVVLIIAILLAIAIPTFLGARDSANARATQSNLRNGLTAEQTYWTNNQSWDTALTATDSVKATETALDWQTTAPAAGAWKGNTVLVAADTTNNGVILTGLGKDNKCYSIEAIDQPVTAGTTAPAGTYYYATNATSGAGGFSCASPTAPSGSAGPATGSAAKTNGSWMSSF